MWLRKEVGSVTQSWRGTTYTWEHDGDVVEVPDELGLELLAIRGAGFSEELEAPKPAEDETGGDGDGEGSDPEGETGADDPDGTDGNDDVGAEQGDEDEPGKK
jgi:hypothetical protein